MKYHEAREQLEYALKHQQSIRILKLKEIMQSLGISLDSSESVHVLKLENEMLRKRMRHE